MTDVVIRVRRPRGKGLRGRAAKRRKQQLGALLLSHRAYRANRLPTPLRVDSEGRPL